MGFDLLEYPEPETADVVSGRNNSMTAVEKVGGQNWRKQLNTASRKKTASRVIPTKPAKQTS